VAGASGNETFGAAARAYGVRDPRVLAALDVVPRHLFVEAGTEHHAWVDAALPLPCGQTTSQPTLIALMIEALRLGPDSRVLEVGTGYGYEAALLSHVAAQVWTIEWWPQLAERARANLAAAGISGVHVEVGDGRAGVPEGAPYDGIVVAAVIPAALVEQLAPGGRLVAPVGAEGWERCLAYRRDPDGLHLVEDLGEVRFVPLIGH
jgi:protein-L-isoaspartate(D-aspartate) O-methyltransferase